MNDPIIIIGAGLAGWSTARALRKLDATRPLVLIAADSADVYAKPALSNAFALKRSPAQLVSTPAPAMAQSLNLALHAHSRVEAIDAAGRTLRVRDGAGVRTLGYSALVIATGAAPIALPIAGDASARVMSVNSLDDFAVLHALLERRDALGAPVDTIAAPADTVAEPANATPPAVPGRDIVIMGAGLIGCEFANDLTLAGHRVHVVDPSARPLAALLPEEAGRALESALADIGVTWHFGATVLSVDANAAAPPRLCVRLSDGRQLEADIVLSAVGLRADTALAQAAGLVCERGIVVDAALQSSAPGIYALGDCAQYASAGARTLPFVMPIMVAAKALASTLCGDSTPLVFPLMPVSIKTPALPIVAALAHPAQAGAWQAGVDADAGLWRFVDPAGAQRGFVLLGKHTARRAELSASTVA
jgi:rubredoxin-NAD+ reductase